MTIPTILKSKAFWTFSVLTGSVSSAVAFDRYKANELYKEYLKEASKHGSLPLPSNQTPRCLSIFLLSPNKAHHQSILNTYKSYAVELLTVAGVDYKWIVEVDGEEAKGFWDKMAGDGNKPELMTDENVKVLDLDELRSNLLNYKLREGHEDTVNVTGDRTADNTVDDTEILWNSLRSKYAPLPKSEWPPGSDGFLTLDTYTFESLSSYLASLKNDSESVHAIETTSSNQWWWPWSSSLNSPNQPQNLQQFNHPINLYNLPCCHSQSPLSRLTRFLFGQQDMTKQIGEAVLKIINEQPEPERSLL